MNINKNNVKLRPVNRTMKCKYEGDGIYEGRCKGTKEVDPCVGYNKCDMYKPENDILTNNEILQEAKQKILARHQHVLYPNGQKLRDFELIHELAELQKKYG